MKDLPHHMKKLNRRVMRSAQREEKELPEIPTWEDTNQEKRKKEKRAQKAERKEHTPKHKTPEERNKEMKSGRVPVIEKNNAKPPHTPKTKKKTPRI